MTIPFDKLKRLEAEATKGPWKRIAQGGSSTITCATGDHRTDNRIPAYGHRDDLGYCIAHPFLEEDGRARWDFVEFAHRDAELITSLRNHALPLITAAEQAGHAEKLIEALEFYANADQYADQVCCGQAQQVSEFEQDCCGYPVSTVQRDAGDQARAALRAYREAVG